MRDVYNAKGNPAVKSGKKTEEEVILEFIETFEVGGISVPVAEDGSFQTVMLPQWGVNLIDAWAEDEYGNQSKLSPSFQYSSQYLGYADATLEDVIQGKLPAHHMEAAEASEPTRY